MKLQLFKVAISSFAILLTISCATGQPKSGPETQIEKMEASKPTASDADLIPTEVLVTEQIAAKSKRGGSSSSIGTDAYDVRTQTAWFYGQKPIVTCFNHIDSFGANSSTAKKALENSIKRWQDYFKAKKIVQGQPARSPNSNFKLVGKCKGNEDLVIFFGTGPIFGGLQDLKAVQRLHFPAAYVNKTHMTPDMAWGKGYVRLVAQGYYGQEDKKHFPDWSRPGALETVLTHELGHVLGFTHVPQTIMEAELIDQVLTAPPQLNARVRIEIDGAKQLVSCAQCESVHVLTGPSKHPEIWQQLGFKSIEGLRLTKTPNDLRFSQGNPAKHEVELKETSRTALGTTKSLLSNFDEPVNGSSHSSNIYGFVQAGATKMPILLEDTVGTARSAIGVRMPINGEMVEIGRFERE